MSDLAKLRKEKNILRAELAAWLHDARKAGIKEEWLPDEFKEWLGSRDVTGIHLYADDFGKWLLAQAHGIAHFDKQDPDKQAPGSSYLSTPFGFEDTYSQRFASPPCWMQDLTNLWKRDYAREALSKTYADGRIPINEISLWSWSETTGALTKSSWLATILKGIELTHPFLERSFLESLDNKLNTLISRKDADIQTILGNLQRNIPTSSSHQPFRGLKTQVSGKNELTNLPQFLRFLNSWLEEAKKVEIKNKLTQRHWEQFLDELQQLLSHLQQALSFLSWRLLSVRTDGLEYLLSANSIPDLLARKDLLTDAWDRVQTLLEETYPLGLEVYRDENGPVFVVPDMDNLLGLTDSDHNNKTLREFILEAFRQGTVKGDPCLALAGEIVPHFNLDKEAWDGQSKLPPIGKDHLKETLPLQADPQWVAEQWCNLPKPQERCTVCGLRPQGPGKKARDRRMCDVCEKRRSDRAKEWAANIGRAFLSTIWLDDVADQNGRIALLVGTFDLDFWLDGTLVRSLAVRDPKNAPDNTKTEDIAKNPSFARLRRIWETTRKFWEETLKEAKDKLTARPRLFLKGSVKNGSLGPYHAYELRIQGRKVAVLWVPEKDDGVDIPKKYRGGFWVIENLEYLDNVYGQPFRDLVQSLQRDQAGLSVYEPSEYGHAGQPIATFIIAEDGVRESEEKHLPLIPILAEPRTFMALVPAESAFEIVKAIKTKYEREMGKVRNRLPLHLGVVFAGRKMPLKAIIDAGRRMLKIDASNLTEGWTVKKKKIFGQPNNPNEKRGLKALRILKMQDLLGDKVDQFRMVCCIKLEKDIAGQKRQFNWFVPALMGDGQTEDRWYPYVFLASPDEPTDRTRYYKTDLGNPWNSSHPWLVHAGELKPGDKIYFTPATFDFEFLDSNVRRFEVFYGENGKRMGSLAKPYLLDEVETLEKIWKFIAKDSQRGKSRLSSTQIYAIRDLIESKREEWYEEPGSSFKDESFKKFCYDLFVNAQWQWGKPNNRELNWLADMAVRGYFTDAIYLFHHAMKNKISGEKQ